MAKPIAAMPIVRGEAAARIEKEMIEGTPRSAKRDQFFAQADRAFSSLKNSPFTISKEGASRGA